MDVEKDDGITKSQTIPEDVSGVQTEDPKPTNAAFDEAVEIYGDVATAEELGYVHRGCVDSLCHASYLNRHC
jgi:hypothetical protein